MATYLSMGIALSVLAASCGGGSPHAANSHHARQRVRTASPTTTKPARSPDVGSTTTVPATTVPTTTVVPAVPRSGFQGIYEFAGNNSAADAGNPELAGVVLVYYWSQIEPTKGTYDWGLIQSDMAPWVAAHKKVILRISTSGAASWAPPYSGDGTPSWVYADGARSVSDDGATVPVYWDQAYLSDYATFVAAFGAQFDGNPNVAFIEPGIGMGGETLPDTEASSAVVGNWEADGYTDGLWLSTVETIATYFESAFPSTPVYPLVDRTFFDGNAGDIDAVMAWFKERPGWGLQNDGLSASQTLSTEWSGVPLALEQLNAAQDSGDCVCDDITNGLDNLHGEYLLLYQSDIDNPSNAAYLRQAAARAG